MFDYSTTELAKIDETLEPTLNWGATKVAETEQMALDATRLLSCTEDRLNDFQGQGFFKRCWFKLCGKHGEIQLANQNDLIEMQKYAWRYIDLLQERDLLMAHSIITVKNNLMTLAVEQEETRREITRMAERVYERFIALEDKVKDIEGTQKIHSWLLTLDMCGYEDKFPPNFRLLKVVQDFLYLKDDLWNIKDIKYLQKAVKEVGLSWNTNIRLSEFIGGLIKEIEETSINNYQSLLYIDTSTSHEYIPETFILDNIPVPSYTSLYQIAENYSGSSDTIDILIDKMQISKTEAIETVLTTFITRQGIDLTASIPIRDLAVELLCCMHLSKTLFHNNEVKTDKEVCFSNSTVDNSTTYDDLFLLLDREDFKQRRNDMVGKLVEEYDIPNGTVMDAMNSVQMELFAPNEFHELLYQDRPVPVGYEETISQPFMTAFILSTLNLKASSSVLELKSGSGYQTAILSTIVNEVYGVESVFELLVMAEGGFKIGRFSNIKMKSGDCKKGWQENAPFDAIIATASFETIPSHLFRQLSIGGELIAPVNKDQFKKNGEGQVLCLFTKPNDSKVETEILLEVKYSMMP
jgi:protein-L-isoaspartate(D-aspartate) O-methyltransferase